MDSDRHYAVLSKLVDYTKSPSLSHLRNPYQLQKLAREIVQIVDRAGSVWTKWEGLREDLAKAAAPCWIPIDDLHSCLNRLPGPPLTLSDVKQRLRALWEEPWAAYPNEELKESCLALYTQERAAGTELIAIIGALQEHIELEEDRLRREQDEAYRAAREAERLNRIQRFHSGADVGWTLIDASTSLHCRRNGRTFRISQTKDRRWQLYRTDKADEDIQLGLYGSRRDANKALDKMAYEPEV